MSMSGVDFRLVKQSRQQPLATMANLSDRLAGIPDQDLSPVIRDAIMATRKLAIRYLWVDALCILQGDWLDWERQSVKTADVYRNAYCTIATPASAHCGQSFRYSAPGLDVPVSLPTPSRRGRRVPYQITLSASRFGTPTRSNPPWNQLAGVRAGGLSKRR